MGLEEELSKKELEKKFDFLGKGAIIDEDLNVVITIDQFMEIMTHVYASNKNMRKVAVGLHTPVGREGNEELEDFVKDKKAPNAHNIAVNNLLGDDIKEVLNSLAPREREVIIWRNGLDGEGIKSLRDIAKI